METARKAQKMVKRAYRIPSCYFFIIRVMYIVTCRPDFSLEELFQSSLPYKICSREANYELWSLYCTQAHFVDIGPA